MYNSPYLIQGVPSSVTSFLEIPLPLENLQISPNLYVDHSSVNSGNRNSGTLTDSCLCKKFHIIMSGEFFIVSSIEY